MVCIIVRKSKILAALVQEWESRKHCPPQNVSPMWVKVVMGVGWKFIIDDQMCVHIDHRLIIK